MKIISTAIALLGIGLFPLIADAAASPPKPTHLGAKIYGNADSGKDIMERWCVGCHKSGPTLDDQIPTLESLAANPSRTDGVVRTFLMQPHRPMPPVELSTQQIEDIIAYLQTLRPKAGQSH